MQKTFLILALVLGSMANASAIASDENRKIFAEHEPGQVPTNEPDLALTPEQQVVWETVHARWQAWLDDDLDAYLAIHHNSWHRWSLRSDSLEHRDDISSFWHQAKNNERTLAFDLTPISVDIYGDSRFAAVHYVAYETVRRLRERTAPDGRIIPVGNETEISIRFSDFMIREGDTWYYIGGYRDGSCALFKGFGRLCDN